MGEHGPDVPGSCVTCAVLSGTGICELLNVLQTKTWLPSHGAVSVSSTSISCQVERRCTIVAGRITFTEKSDYPE
jgi:hypothetical protein